MGRPINKKFITPEGFQIQAVANISGTNTICEIVEQRGVSQFFLRNPNDESLFEAEMVDNDAPNENEFYVQVDPNEAGNDTLEFARKITNRRVYTHEGISRDWDIAPDEDSGIASFVIPVLSVAVDPTQSIVTADPTSGTIPPLIGQEQILVTLQAVDTNGDNITSGGETVVFSVDDPGVVFIGTVSDNGDGTYTQSFDYSGYSGLTPGDITVSATINGDPVTDTATVSITSGGG